MNKHSTQPGTETAKTPAAPMDAVFHIEISDDLMKAAIKEYIPAVGGGKEPSHKSLHAELKKAKISISPSTEVLDELLMRIARQEDVTGYVVAEGKMPKDSTDGHVELFGKLDKPVFRNDVVGKYVPAVQGEDGVTVTGTALKCENCGSSKDSRPFEDSGLHVDDETKKVLSKGYGLLVEEAGSLKVKPLFRISKDKLKITATIAAEDFMGHEITLERLKQALWEMGVRTSNDEAVIAALKQSKAGGEKVDDVVVAKGKAPKEGKDGYAKLLLPDDNPEDSETHVVDPRERSIFRTIKENTLIVKIVPPVEGEAGMNVFGEKLFPMESREAEVVLGEGVAMADDGVTVVAECTGMISWVGNTVSVLDYVEIKGDVDYKTGNIKMESGSVMITGAVIDGFQVSAPGDVLVNQFVESAIITAGGSVSVNYGIAMGNNGLIKAKGEVRAKFMETAVIEAGGNVHVAQNASNCTITTQGKLIATEGKGLILGGTIHARDGVVANEIGSDFGVVTHIILGPDECEAYEDLLTEKRIIKDKLKKIEKTVGAGSSKDLLKKCCESKKAKLSQILRARDLGECRLEEIEKIRNEVREKHMDAFNARVKVAKVAWPGTKVTILGQTFELKEPLRGGVIFFNPSTRKIVAG